MRKETIGMLFHIISIICGIWFLLTGWIWVYGAAAFISYPISFIGLLFWGLGCKFRSANTQSIPILYFVGLVISLLSILFYK